MYTHIGFGGIAFFTILKKCLSITEYLIFYITSFHMNNLQIMIDQVSYNNHQMIAYLFVELQLLLHFTISHHHINVRLLASQNQTLHEVTGYKCTS